MKQFGIVKENECLKKYNTYGLGGITKYLIIPYKDKLSDLIKYLRDHSIKYFVIGNGSNIILSDDYFDGAIIKLDKLDKIEINNNECIVGSGVMLNNLVNKTLNMSYTNLAFLMGIPGTVGGTICSNAGAYNENIFSYVKDVTILDENLNIKKIKKDSIEYSYRYTEFRLRNIIILETTLVLEKGNIEETKQKIKENFDKRKKTQPLEYKNAGSVFKNPEGYSAGKLIEEAGLKGKTIGGAKVSEKHANFIVNFNNAKSSDIITLIDLIKKEIKEKYNIVLELEQIIIDW